MAAIAASPLALGWTGAAQAAGTIGSTHRLDSDAQALWLTLGV
jgi:hypothetical protein